MVECWVRTWLSRCRLEGAGAGRVFAPNLALASEVEGFLAERVVEASGRVVTCAGSARAVVHALEFFDAGLKGVALRRERSTLRIELGNALLGGFGVDCAFHIEAPNAVALGIELMMF